MVKIYLVSEYPPVLWSRSKGERRAKRQVLCVGEHSITWEIIVVRPVKELPHNKGAINVYEYWCTCTHL